MEARFLQIELEAHSRKQEGEEDEIVFLDSDDLRDLSKLIHHVRQSRALILVLTRKVLTRPVRRALRPAALSQPRHRPCLSPASVHALADLLLALPLVFAGASLRAVLHHRGADGH
jgi:hypothetical protein